MIRLISGTETKQRKDDAADDHALDERPETEQEIKAGDVLFLQELAVTMPNSGNGRRELTDRTLWRDVAANDVRGACALGAIPVAYGLNLLAVG